MYVPGTAHTRREKGEEGENVVRPELQAHRTFRTSSPSSSSSWPSYSAQDGDGTCLFFVLSFIFRTEIGIRHSAF